MFTGCVKKGAVG